MNERDRQLQRIRDSFEAQSLMRSFRASLDQVEAGRAVISAPVTDGVLQQHGVAHAGLTFSLGDSAAGYAGMSVLDQMDVMTVEMKINLLAPGKGPHLRATGRVIRPGRRLVVVAADVDSIDLQGSATLIAVLQGTMIPVPREA